MPCRDAGDAPMKHADDAIAWTGFPLHDDVIVTRAEGWTIRHVPDISLDEVLRALREPGEVLKRSKKSTSSRVGNWVVKTSLRGGFGALKRTLCLSRYRRGWTAARYLERKGVSVPRALAFAEERNGGLIMRNALVSQYLDGCCDVEAHADAMIVRAAGDDEVAAYLRRLAEAVNALCASGAFHGDLAGKNILTRDGEAFYFIDLDGVGLNVAYTDAMRFKNHVQLYDSLCDKWPDAFLEPFLLHMLPDRLDAARWMDHVRSAQAQRRAIIEAKWRKQGRIP